MKQLSFQVSSMSKVLVALGANTTLPGQTLENALFSAFDAIDSGEIRLTQRSFLYSTPCFPAGAGPDYINAAIQCESALLPARVLDRLHEIEAGFGRQRLHRWGQRTMDLDLLAYGDLVLPDPATHDHWRNLPMDVQQKQAPDRLVLPHPRLHERAFVLRPLADIAPQWRHPMLGRTVAQMLDDLPDAEKSQITRI